jgi:thymidine kinase
MAAQLEVIAGPMFAGKSELLISRIHRAERASKRIRILKPASDRRSRDVIASRSIGPGGASIVRSTLPAASVRGAEDFARLTGDGMFDVLAVDEAQFFPLDSPPTDRLGWFGRAVLQLRRAHADRAVQIIIAGLDMDFAGRPFGPMPGLMAMADRIDRLAGICMVCGSMEGRFSQRLIDRKTQLLVGDVGEYQVRCRECYEPVNAKANRSGAALQGLKRPAGPQWDPVK